MLPFAFLSSQFGQRGALQSHNIEVTLRLFVVTVIFVIPVATLEIRTHVKQILSVQFLRLNLKVLRGARPLSGFRVWVLAISLLHMVDEERDPGVLVGIL